MTIVAEKWNFPWFEDWGDSWATSSRDSIFFVLAGRGTLMLNSVVRFSPSRMAWEALGPDPERQMNRGVGLRRDAGRIAGLWRIFMVFPEGAFIRKTVSLVKEVSKFSKKALKDGSSNFRRKRKKTSGMFARLSVEILFPACKIRAKGKNEYIKTKKLLRFFSHVGIIIFPWIFNLV